MKKAIGIIIIIIGFILGLYVGGWLLFLSPIINAARAYDANTLTALEICITVLKCVFATPVSTFIYGLLSRIGVVLVCESELDKFNKLMKL